MGFLGKLFGIAGKLTVLTADIETASIAVMRLRAMGLDKALDEAAADGKGITLSAEEAKTLDYLIDTVDKLRARAEVYFRKYFRKG